MLRRILFLFLAIGWGVTASSQNGSYRQELSVGPSFGMTFSSISFSPRVNKTLKQGFTGGLTLRWKTEKSLGLQAEVNFAQQGWEELFEEQPQYVYSRTINYIELPFLTHIYFGEGHFKFFFNLGPKIGYAFGESTESNLDGATPNRNNAQHDMAIQKKFDWGLCGGPGLELSTGIGSFLLEGRYYYALGDIFNSEKKDPFSRSASQVISAKVTYLFHLKR